MWRRRALPEEVMRRVEAAGGKAVPTGIEHGTVTVVIDGHPFEVTTLREDVETFGRKARVVFGRDWSRDAERRDFTINALSATRDGKVFDYVGGLADIAARRVRFIGEPQRRIEEDYLRILRFFRFQAHFGEGAPDAAGLLACIRERAGLETLSRERVRMELLKLLVAPRATPTLAVMAESGILGMVLGGVPFIASFENMVKVEAALGVEPDALRRLGALGVWVIEDAERLGAAVAARQRRIRTARGARSLVARDAGDGRAAGARAPLSSRAAILPRSRAARLGALASGCGRCRLARPRDVAAALDGARFSAQGGGLHRAAAWPPGPPLGAALRAAEDGVDRGRFSRRPHRWTRLPEGALEAVSGG